jgi:ubiquinone/menaquinone biosynthesis C-methylase UbiE
MTPPIDTDKLVRWYDFQAPLYAIWRNRYDTELVRHVTQIFHGRPPQRLLDAGCGTGLFSIALARALPDSELRGVDLSRGMLSVAAREARSHDLSNLCFLRADVTRLPFAAGTFDTVVAAGLLANVNRRPDVLHELGRVLRADGRVVVVEFDRDSMGALSRLVFRLMILGYRTVSTVFSRFRFADRWDLRSSTIDRTQLTRWAEQARLRIGSAETRANHMIYQLHRGPRR